MVVISEQSIDPADNDSSQVKTEQGNEEKNKQRIF